jgi:NADH-quinone oxidoreductase subunit N
MMNWMLFSPEFFTLGMAGVFMVLSLMPQHAKRDYHIAWILALVGLIICIANLHQTITQTNTPVSILFNNTYQVDQFSQYFKLIIYIGFLLIIGMCRHLAGISEKRHSEFYLILSLCTLALMVLVSSIHFLPLYIALETSSYSLYVLVFLRKGYAKGLGSSLKYFFIGATASALMLFGVALLYYTGKSLYFVDLAQTLPDQLQYPMTQMGVILILSGLLFKLAAVPFHFWAPDVYEGAPHQVAAYIATVSKVAAVAVIIRLIILCGTGANHLIIFLMTVSVLSMTIGNLSAIVQDDLKRLLAFSSIAHAGYLLIGVLSFNAMGWVSTIFYALSLLIMKFTAFMAVIIVGQQGNNMSVSQLAGLHKKAPAFALALMLALFGLAGIPPTIGFTAKLLIFKAALQKGYLLLVIFAMINVVISLYYYLNVLKVTYFTVPENDNENPVIETIPIKLLAYLMIVLMIAGGLFPQKMITIASSMIEHMMRF